jgi:hypothetical protein
VEAGGESILFFHGLAFPVGPLKKTLMIKTALENQYYVTSRHPIDRANFQAVLNNFHMTYISSNYDENKAHWMNYFSVPASIPEYKRRMACIEIGKHIGVNDYRIALSNIISD